MSREAWGTPPDIEPEHCPLCGETSHVDGCEVGALQAKHNAEVSRLQQRISALEKDAARWQPIETADSNTLALLYAPPEALFAEPAKHLGEFRVAAPRNWTWATHWMPLPAPPAALSQQKGGA